MESIRVKIETRVLQEINFAVCIDIIIENEQNVKQMSKNFMPLQLYHNIKNVVCQLVELFYKFQLPIILPTFSFSLLAINRSSPVYAPEATNKILVVST